MVIVVFVLHFGIASIVMAIIGLCIEFGLAYSESYFLVMCK